MSKYFIERNQAVNALNEAQIEGTDTYKGLGLAKQIIDKLPCECRPKGEWIPVYGKNGKTIMSYKCSKCDFHPKHAIITDFCGGCGADMRGKAE